MLVCIYIVSISTVLLISSLVLGCHDTISNLVKSSVHSNLQFVEPIVYFPSHRNGPLDYCDVLSDIGISDGSTVYIRWRLRGGSSQGIDEGKSILLV